jgi:hypothetical protein
MSYRYEQFNQALRLLDGRLAIAGAPAYNLVVCGGTALMANDLVQRTTKDVDIVAMADDEGSLIDPAPLPDPLVKAAQEVADDLGLPDSWLNNGPSSGDGGIFRLGLPLDFSERLSWERFGKKLTVAFVDRIDQIHFKLYAAVDQFGSYHASDLKELDPTDEELLTAAAWTRTHDPSVGYLESLMMFFRKYGYEHLAERV